MYFKNSIGKVYLNYEKVVLESSDEKYSFESKNPMLLQAAYEEYVKTLQEVEMEEFCLERLNDLLDDDRF